MPTQGQCIGKSSSVSVLRSRLGTNRHITITSSDNERCSIAVKMVSEEKHSYFHLPFEATTVMLFALLAAIITILKSNVIVLDYEHGLRALRSESKIFRSRKDRSRNMFPYVVQWNISIDIDYNTTKGFPSLRSRYVHYPTKNVKFTVSIDDDDDDAFHDPTMIYDQSDSSDLPTMERKKWPDHDFDPNCKPSASWQSTFYPTCNEIHSNADMRQVMIDEEFTLLSSKGYWRHAWLHDVKGRSDQYMSNIPFKNTVWKTLKYVSYSRSHFLVCFLFMTLWLILISM